VTVDAVPTDIELATSSYECVTRNVSGPEHVGLPRSIVGGNQSRARPDGLYAGRARSLVVCLEDCFDSTSRFMNVLCVPAVLRL